jgi:hypothetical protein
VHSPLVLIRNISTAPALGDILAAATPATHNNTPLHA